MPGYTGPNNIGGIGGGAGSNFSLGNMFSGIGNFGKSLGNFMGSQAGEGLFSLAGMGAGLYGMNKSFDLAENQLGIMHDQEDRAAKAQQLQTGNQLSLALQTTTPGTPEHERIKAAIAEGQFNVSAAAA